jgi:hypothetical protein
VREERVLLRLAVPVDLVEEDDRGPALQGGGAPRVLDDTTQGRDAVGRGVEGGEARPDRLREEPPDRGLPGSGRSPQDAGGEAAALDQAALRGARSEDGVLADDLVERPRPHPVGEGAHAIRR